MLFANETVLWMVGFALIPHGIFTILYLIFKGKSVSEEKIFRHDLVGIFLIIAFLLIPLRQIFWHYSDPENVNIFARVFGYQLLISPLLYLYSQSLVIPGFRFSLRILCHLIPFGLFSLFFIFFQTKAIDPGYYILIMDPTREPTTAGKWIGLINFSVLIFYSVKIVRLVKFHKSNIVDYLSQISEKQTLNWLYWIIASFYLTIILTVTISIITRMTHVGYLNIQVTLLDFNIMFWSLYAVFVYTMSFFFIQQNRILPDSVESGDANPDIDNNKDFDISENLENSENFNNLESLKAKETLAFPKTQSTNSDNTQSSKYKKSGLTDESKTTIHTQLIQTMESKKPYLDEELNLKKLSKILNVSQNHLSQVINELENQSFFHFINEWRAKESARLIEEDKAKDKKLIEIAFESGFNSLSSFNLHFKRVTGKTPREFR